jgi:uncharacterized protein (TIGR00255 family)
MKSMTAFGYSEHRDESWHFAVTLKSYNNRFLDILVYLPGGLAPLEQRARELLSARVQRGRVELYVRATELGERPPLAIEPAVVRGYVEALRHLAAAARIRERVRLTHLLRLEGILKPAEAPDLEQVWKVLAPVIDSAAAEFEAMRTREGEATRRDIEALLQGIAAEVERVSDNADRLEAKIGEDLRRRFRDLLGQGIDESRLLAETAIVLSKADIHEELVRIRSHLSNFREIMAGGGAMGKKLDFLCQELNREFNTIGSKNLLVEVDSAVVALKDTLERIREQLRNVE